MDTVYTSSIFNEKNIKTTKNQFSFNIKGKKKLL